MVQAYYGGNDAYASSTSGPTTIQILFPPTATTTTTTATSAFLPILAGQQLALSAQVSCNTSCGWVTYYLDGYWIGSVGLDSSGHANGLTQPNVSVGVHTLIVQYPGDDSHLPSTSNPVVFTMTSGARATVYSYDITSYQPNGNVQEFTDSTNGTWSDIRYDNLNRLRSATKDVAGQPTQYLCWTYDDFGNRKSQSVEASQCRDSDPTPTTTAHYNSLSQIDGVTPSQDVDCFEGGAYVNTVHGLCYDAAGNVTAAGSVTDPGSLITDATHQYLYDAEGRVCAEANAPISGGLVITQYIYDAEGRRVAKGTTTDTSLSCDTSNFVQTASYVLGPSGEQVTEMDGNGNWVHTNVYAAGQLVATYKNDATAGQAVTPGLHFHLADWLGTNRVQLTSTGQPEQNCPSLPFGDALNCTGAADATEHHFTGKERDTESGLDYFGARYYASTMGRMMSPDWSAKAEPVPYAKLDNPQSLNLYGYVGNNPLSRSDADGHETWRQYLARAQESAEGTINRIGQKVTGTAEFSIRDSGDRAVLAGAILRGANTAASIIVPAIASDGLSLEGEGAAEAGTVTRYMGPGEAAAAEGIRRYSE